MDSYEGRPNEPITLHKYLYANGNPVSNTDPSGRFSISDAVLSVYVRVQLLGLAHPVIASGITSGLSYLNLALFVVNKDYRENLLASAGPVGAGTLLANNLSAATRGSVQAFKGLLPRILPKIPIPYDSGVALQSVRLSAILARFRVEEGATLYRIGTMGRSQAAEAQFWSLESPLSPGFAARYGIPPQNVAAANFIETATVRAGARFVTRVAPAVGTNPGGGIEVVVEPGDIIMRAFNAGM